MKTLALTAATLATLAGTTSAQTEIFFSEYQFNMPRISAMGLDGSSPHLLFAPAAAQWLPLGLTVNATTQRLIWMDSAGASELMSANFDGSNPVTLATPPGFARGPKLDSQGRVYFSSNNTVRRVNADGSNPLTLFTSVSTDPVGDVCVDAFNSHVYVGAEGEIKRMDLDGLNVKTIVKGISQTRAIGLDIAHGHIYWLDADTISDYVGRARLDGSDFKVIVDLSPLVVQSSGLITLLVDGAGGHIYYADELTGTIYRADLNGQGVTPIYTSPSGLSPSGLTLSTGDPVQVLQDCNGNLINDDIDIAGGAPDCDNNGVIDTCQINPCPQRVLLLDQGSNAASSNGRALGQPSQWQIFQPFDVPAGGWSIGELAIDGFTSNYGDGTGITLRLFPDNGTGTRPNEAIELGSAATQLRFNTNFVNWVYAPMSAALTAGRYWVRIEGNNPTAYAGSINLGFTGLQSLSRGSSGTFSSPASPIALRVIQANACYVNCDASTLAPVLNVNDYTCFLNQYAAGSSYANCDASTLAPVLNVNDFTCFINKYAAGCP